MDNIFFEDKNGIKRSLRCEKSAIELFVECDLPRIEAGLFFYLGKNNAQNAEQALSVSEEFLRSDGLFMTLCGFALRKNEGYKNKGVVEDGLLGGVEGNFSSVLYVKNGQIFYDLEFCCVGCGGEMHLDLGVATVSRVKKVRRVVRRLDESLISITYVAKHEFIEADFE